MFLFCTVGSIQHLELIFSFILFGGGFHYPTLKNMMLNIHHK